MIRYTLIIFLIIHILGDFYFQTEKVANRKRTDFKWTIYHIIVYGVITVLLIYIFLPRLDCRYGVAFVISHAVIDILKFFICRYLGQSKYRYALNKLNVFLIDQAMHLFVIFIIVYSMRNIDIGNQYREKLQIFFDIFHLSETEILRWTVKFLIIHKPTNIFIANVLDLYKPLEKRQKIVNDKNAGRFIGTLERIIMTIFISINQYSAVGLVLTAKSIARYEKISHEQDFAEYYLAGTLLSTISAVCVSILF